jgi:hypothetical protein
MSKTIKKIPKIEINNILLAKNVANLYDLVKSEKWRYFYDDDLDQLYITPKEGVKKNFNLVSVSQELSVYLDNSSNLGGVMISYFVSNLTNHDDLFEPFKKIFTKQFDGGKTIPKSNKESINNLTTAIISELEKSVLNNPK